MHQFDSAPPLPRAVVEVSWRREFACDDGALPVDQYRGESAWFATQHGKAELVSSSFASVAGISVRTAEVDTDCLGTFTGDIERPGAAVDVVVRKASLVHGEGAFLTLGSEGSFFPHPVLGFVPAGLELLAFVDRIQQVAVVEKSRLVPTNWSHVDMPVGGELAIDPVWLTGIGFGRHGVCVVGLDESDAPRGTPVKGIHDLGSLRTALHEMGRADLVRTVRVMTDMRAHANPTRQAAITDLAASLATRLTRGCPECRQAGWGLTQVEDGLPCAWCSTATTAAKQWVFGCVACSYSLTKPAPGPDKADPGRCSICNP